MNDQVSPDLPPVRFPWPVLFIFGTIFIGLALDRISGNLTRSFFDNTLLQATGGILVLIALGLENWSLNSLKRHGTTIWPHRSASSLVIDGPYQYSRNPIYIAHTIFLLGIGLLIISPFIVYLLPFFSYCEFRFSIEPEERHLLQKFGSDFSEYMARTRRWL